MKYFSSYLNKSLENPELRKAFLRVHYLDDMADQFILLRSKRGISQSSLAEIAKTTQAVISRVENGSVNSSLQTIQKLAEALNASLKIDIIPDEEMRIHEFFTNYFRSYENGEKIVEQDSGIASNIFINDRSKCLNIDTPQLDVDWSFIENNEKAMA